MFFHCKESKKDRMVETPCDQYRRQIIRNSKNNYKRDQIKMKEEKRYIYVLSDNGEWIKIEKYK